MRQMTQCYDKHQYQTPEVLNKTWLEKGLLSDRMPRNRSEYHHIMYLRPGMSILLEANI